jgi:hypothetical protein
VPAEIPPLQKSNDAQRSVSGSIPLRSVRAAIAWVRQVPQNLRWDFEKDFRSRLETTL